MPLLRMLAFFIVINVATLFHSYAKDTTSILLFGDSITAGYGLSTDEVLAVRMEAQLTAKSYKVHVINGGVSGDTSGGGRNRLAWTLTRYKPDIVVVALGGNDALRAISPAITRDNLASILALLKEQHIKTLFSAVRAPANLGADYSDNFNRIYPELAQKYNVPLYPFLLTPIYGKPDLMQEDGIHPNAEGVNIIAEKLVYYMIKNKMLTPNP